MRTASAIAVIAVTVAGFVAPRTHAAEETKKPAAPAKLAEGWVSLFDGKSLAGWKASENVRSFSVRDGAIVAHGPRSHLFYLGDVCKHEFRNFELKIDAMTEKGSNGGIYFHTRWKPRGWPGAGYEVQVNNTHGDWRKGGSLYAVKDVRKAPAADGQWYTTHIIVRGKRIVIKVDGKTVVEHTEPAGAARKDGRPGRYISSGTFALQGHDPKSVVHYKNILVKPLPDDEEGWVTLFNGKDLTGWKVSENPKSVTVRDGAIVTHGPRAHVFYMGEVCQHDFKDFELELEAMCEANSNGGVFFHTAWQEKGWPFKGYECQVNNTYKDPVKTGSLYHVRDRTTSPVKDKEWFKLHISVRGKRIVIQVNGKTTVDWTQPPDWKPGEGRDRQLSSGTFALQGHDPGSTVHYRNIRVRPLPPPKLKPADTAAPKKKAP